MVGGFQVDSGLTDRSACSLSLGRYAAAAALLLPDILYGPFGICASTSHNLQVRVQYLANLVQHLAQSESPNPLP